MDIAIIGGGAAGFFAAICVKENYPGANVIVFEKSKKLLSKVRISGGGRCNVTNACEGVGALCNAYPRGGKQLRKVFHIFDNHDAMRWFESRGVALVTQPDGCVFPASQDSQSIIDCFLRECHRLGIKIQTEISFTALYSKSQRLEVVVNKGEVQYFNKVIICTGGTKSNEILNCLDALGQPREQPVPSLFSFSIPENHVTKLMGVVVDNVITNIQGTKLSANGPLLITHWGMSGPAVLKLSSYGARFIHENKYTFNLKVNWVNEKNDSVVGEYLNDVIKTHSKKQIDNFAPYTLSTRLWLFLLVKCDIQETRKWGEISKKELNRLVNILTNDVYEVKGRAAFRDEFVTCGGVGLQGVDMSTMQSKVVPGLYFAGEVLDIDGITGGYNFQAAWSTAYVAAKLE